MAKRRQSPLDRARRLQDGRCPIHGIGCSQVSGMCREDTGEEYDPYLDADYRGRLYMVLECNRNDCGVRIRHLYNADGTIDIELMPQWKYLLTEGLIVGGKKEPAGSKG